MRGWWRPMQVTVQNVPGGSGRIIAASASGEASIPPGTPNTRLMRSGGGRMPSSSQRIALITWPTSKRLDLERDAGLRRALDDPAAGRRRA